MDVMDGHFVPNITFGPRLVRALHNRVQLKLDVHLMMNEPDRLISSLADAGADQLIIHQEASPDLYRILQTIRKLHMKAGVALNPTTSIEALEEILSLVDVIQVMTVNPGSGGQEFIQNELDKVRRLRKMLNEKNLRIPIAVDGGINPQTAPLAARAGARVLVAGSSVFNSNASVAENIAALRASVKEILEES